MSNDLVDPIYCSSSFLMYRTIVDKDKIFKENIRNFLVEPPKNRTKIKNSEELYLSLKSQIEQKINSGAKVALCLSGGIDSAILAKMLPKDTMTYTFKCVVPGKEVIDETINAKKYADECGLKNKIIEIYWQDFEKYAPILMKHKGAPIHSIEIQIYKAALEAKKDGIDILLFGESSDSLYGGLSGLLSKDWLIGEFVDRYSYVLPYKVLKKWTMDLKPYQKYLDNNGFIDVHGFISNEFFRESVNSYINACTTANMDYLMPFSNTILDEKLDLNRIREGENKYIVREIFKKLYQDFIVPPKTPMPRPMDEWLQNYNGPKHPSFYPNCAKNMKGDQKWLIWCLEKYFNLLSIEF